MGHSHLTRAYLIRNETAPVCDKLATELCE